VSLGHLPPRLSDAEALALGRLIDQLGESIPMATAAEISRLRATLADRDAWCEHLAQRESALLLAVRRPFRSRVNRRAERIQRGVEA
jgi:hypothetical protein